MLQLFLPKQQNHESLTQCCNTVTGLAAKRNIGELTESLVMDAFIQKMQNKTVQDQTKRTSSGAFHFAIALNKPAKESRGK